jgi:hypothetical protein
VCKVKKPTEDMISDQLNTQGRLKWAEVGREVCHSCKEGVRIEVKFSAVYSPLEFRLIFQLLVERFGAKDLPSLASVLSVKLT